MKLSRLSSYLTLIAAMNILYALASAFEKDYIRIILSVMNYLVFIYTVAVIENSLADLRLSQKQGGEK
ncbi:hypothetical protein DRO61_11885 [Candidatus Bathyarchaeota archaeon]|nr:MAG: hypothetical protein DRO61_11885 [Candidatus Bathyarchaeota archaeon]